MYICTYQNLSPENKIIEIIGMPACGKTTYMEKLLHNDDSVIDANGLLPCSYLKRQIYKLFSFILEAFNDPKYVGKMILRIIESKQTSYIDALKVLSNWFLVVHMIRRNIDVESVVVFDQGIFQAMWSILFSAQKKDIDLDCDWIPYSFLFPDKIIVLDEPDNTLRLREIGRNKSIRLNYEDNTHIESARYSLKRVLSLLDEIERYEKVIE